MRRQLDDLAFREKPLQVREEFIRNVDRRCANAVRVFQRDSLPLRQVAGSLNAERSLNLLLRETGFAADGGIDVHSEGTTVTGRYSDSDHLDQVPADGPPSRAKDHVGQERSEHRARGMRLNLGRIQRAAESQPEQALNDSYQDSCLASFKRSNSGHRGYLSFLRRLTSCISRRARPSLTQR